MILTVNNDYLLIQRKSVDLCNGEYCVLFAVRAEFLNII
jgi:hypothetical protein